VDDQETMNVDNVCTRLSKGANSEEMSKSEAIKNYVNKVCIKSGSLLNQRGILSINSWNKNERKTKGLTRVLLKKRLAHKFSYLVPMHTHSHLHTLTLSV